MTFDCSFDLKLYYNTCHRQKINKKASLSEYLVVYSGLIQRGQGIWISPPPTFSGQNCDEKFIPCIKKNKEKFYDSKPRSFAFLHFLPIQTIDTGYACTVYTY